MNLPPCALYKHLKPRWVAARRATAAGEQFAETAANVFSERDHSTELLRTAAWPWRHPHIVSTIAGMHYNVMYHLSCVRDGTFPDTRV